MASATATPKKKAKAKKPVKVKRQRPLLTSAELKVAERELRKEFKNVVPNTLCNRGEDPEKNPAFEAKRSVVIVCGHRGCKEERRVATSDLHQVRFCVPHTEEKRLERKNAARRQKHPK